MPLCIAAKSICAIALLSLALSSAQSSAAPFPPNSPSSACQPSSAADFNGLRVFAGTEPIPIVYDCGGHSHPESDCLTRNLDPAKPDEYQGDLIAPSATQGPWSCAMIGGWSAWVPTNRFAPVPATPAITTRQWLGIWVNSHIGAASDRLILTRSPAGNGKIHAEGKASYTNAAHNVHFGKVSGDALAMGPYLHILDSSSPPTCVLDLKYDIPTQTLRAVDNQQCGGFNVSFNGVWRRGLAKK